MAENNYLSEIELRLEVLRVVKEFGTEYQKANPLPIADEYYTWVCKTNKKSSNKRKTIRKVNSVDLSDSKE